MPRLLMFAPCQKAIIDQQDQSISMISILTGIKAQPLPDDQNRATPVPPNAAAPFKWAAVSVWLRQPDDGDRTFEQRFAVHLPNGIVVEGNVVPFSMTTRTHQVSVSGDAFPIGNGGECNLILSVRELGTANWTQVAEYPIEIDLSARITTPVPALS